MTVLELAEYTGELLHLDRFFLISSMTSRIDVHLVFGGAMFR